MLKNNMKNVTKVTLAVALTLPLILAMPNGEIQAASKSPTVESGALTPPPPEVQSIQSNAQLDNIYYANGSVIPGGGLTAKVSINTITYSQMNYIQVDYRLERWTGTAWVTYRSNSVTKSNISALSAESSWTVITGYYYRVVSVHTANDGSTAEKTTHTSPSILF
ncbi:hypothetical protein MH215_21965 [Paenibacillus sp. ACRSA]|uniref:hypothetical protein n=1 Tax=Paenibacillus sp. ACRSA TaxID=2918211 RepID=UPI001EF64C29|nr:hypothetical protein [Paenibacillus sp. ACRSA]MCG7379670.1 hypothetical protein [Paenibacillus sp. ACRSA]